MSEVARKEPVWALGLGLAPVGTALAVEITAAALGSPSPLVNAGALALYLAFPAVLGAWALGSAWAATRRLQFDWPPGALPVGTLACGIWIVTLTQLYRRTEGFSNRELAGLLLAVATLVLALVLALLVWLGLRRFETSEPRLQRGVHWAAVGLALLALGYVGFQNRDGIAQLAPALFLAPLFGAVVLGLSRWLPQPRVGKRVAWIATALCAAATWLTGAMKPDLPRLVLDAGSWGALGIRVVYAATDFDRDGYSSFAGGGDCAPFNAKVNPDARDVPGDHIDNNCFGGDARAYKAPRPEWDAQEKTRRYNVVYVTVEALRPDHLSFFGYDRDTTPNLAAIAKHAVVFEHAYAPATLTRWSLTSIFSTLPSSRVPFIAPRPGGQLKLGKRLPWLPSLLKDAGYRTAAVVPDFGMLSKGGIGLERGFDTYDAETQLVYRGGSMQGFPGEEQVKRASQLIEKFDKGDKPFFLWTHLVEPHFRYDLHPDAPKFGDKPKDRYDSEVWTADKRIGELWAKLGELELQDDTILIVSGDHGEEFGEHGQRFHGSNLFEPQVHTLLMMRIPKHPGRRVKAAVSLNEMPPTLLNLLGLKKPFAQLHSRNLLPLVNGAKDLPGQVLAELFDGWHHSAYQVAMLDWPNKVTWSEIGNFSRTFDLVEDPNEERPVSSPNDAQERLMQHLKDFVEGAAKRPQQR
jgi:arylsulfatase A-like enzyme